VLFAFLVLFMGYIGFILGDMLGKGE